MPTIPSHPFIVGLGGTLRAGSLSERALRVSLQEAERLGARTTLFSGASLDLPHYGQGRMLSGQADALLAALRGCDGLIIASPAYHGTISGFLKNTLDYIEDMRSDAAPYLEGKVVGCIVCAYGWQAIGTTLTTLRSVVHALRGWPTPMGAGLNGAVPLFDDTGACTDPGSRAQLELVAQQVMDFAAWRRSARRAADVPSQVV